MNLCNKFHGNPSNSFAENQWDISLKLTNVNLSVVPEEKSEDHQSHKDTSSGNHEYLYEAVW